MVWEGVRFCVVFLWRGCGGFEVNRGFILSDFLESL
jgi:hypothetical protein